MLPGVDRERQGTTRHRGRAIDRQQNQGAREQRVEHQYPLHGRHRLDHQESIDSLPPGKRQVMEKFFRPVHSPSSQDMNLGKHHHHHPHHQHQDRESHNNTLLEGNNSPSGAHHHHHHREHHHHDNHHHGHPHHHHRHHHPPEHLLCGEEDELHEHHCTSVTLSRASSSSLSSSSSSVSSSWSTEASANDPFSLRLAERPQHSLSCSNIVDVHGRFPEDDSKGPIAFATVNVHGHPRVQVHQGSPRGRREGPSYSTLNRGHSRSEEGLLQTSEDRVGGGSTGRQHRDGPLEHGVLYKTLSLGGSLAFSEEEIHLGAGGPKRAVSSMQLPSKGILKNRETQPDIRKARSMEVLSPRVAKGQGQRQGKDEEKAKVQTEKARENFVKGKIQFSAFLDEITKQVISPSRLNILGVGNTKTSSQSPAPAQAPAQAPAKPKLPPKKHRGSLGEEREPPRRTTATPGKQSSNEPYLGPQKLSHPDKLITYAAKSSYRGSPPPRPQPGGHPGGGPTERKSSLTEGPVASDRQGRYGPLLTEETSTSPELCLQKQHQYKHKSHRPTGAQGQQKPPSPGHQRPAHSPPPPPGLDHGSESPSNKSDSSRNQDLAGSPGSEHNDRYRLGAGPEGRSSKHREMSDADQLRFLQDENADLHQNLLQTVVCIESLEVELQRTREELCQTKENYTRLLETHTGTRHTNNLLGEKLQSANDSMSSERKYLIQRVAQLSSELEDANRTISALEIVNVPCLIKDLLEKHIDSGEAAQKFLQSNQPIFSPYMDSQSQAPRADRVGLLTDSQQRMTAFTPWTQEEGAPINEIYETNAASGPYQCQSPPFSVADISMAIYKKMAGEQAKGVPPHAQSHHQHSLLGTNHHSSPTVPGPVADKGQRGRDVSYVSAQRVLDDFMEQLQPPDEGGVEGGHQGLDWDQGLDKGKGGE